MPALRHLKVIRPISEKCAVALPVRKPNAANRSREHLTEREVERLIEAAKDNRWGHRDATMVLLAFRHGLRAVLRRLQREQGSRSPFVFVSERSAPFSKRDFQAMVERAARAADFDMKIHPHMLRHSCGYKLANDGVDTRTIQSYLGHKSIQHHRPIYRAGADAL